MPLKITEGTILRTGFITAATFVMALYLQQEITKCSVESFDNPDLSRKSWFYKLTLN